ncbi:hypothetical protein [[Eubacterium] cellulosolvens]
MIMKPKIPIIMLTLLLVGTALSLVTPVIAQGNGPKYTKYVSPLNNGAGERWGQVIYNVNPEDDGTFELEVEIEEYLPFADSTVNVKLDGTSIGTIDVDENGNGKATFYVDSFDPASNVIEVVFDSTPTPAAIALKTSIDDYHLWVKGPGRK